MGAIGTHIESRTRRTSANPFVSFTRSLLRKSGWKSSLNGVPLPRAPMDDAPRAALLETASLTSSPTLPSSRAGRNEVGGIGQVDVRGAGKIRVQRDAQKTAIRLGVDRDRGEGSGE